MNFSLLPLVGYIDPGSGMLLLQLAMAGCLSVVACFRKSILRVLGVFRGSTGLSGSGSRPADPADALSKLSDASSRQLPKRPTEEGRQSTDADWSEAA